MNSNMSYNRLDDIEGCMTVHMGVITPTIAVSNRSIIISYYFRKNEETGEIVILSASSGNDHLAESCAELIGSNVFATLEVSYMRLTPFDGGYDIEQVSCFDPKGWIPGFV